MIFTLGFKTFELETSVFLTFGTEKSSYSFTRVPSGVNVVNLRFTESFGTFSMIFKGFGWMYNPNPFVSYFWSQYR